MWAFFEGTGGFEFDEDGVFNAEVAAVFSDELAVVIDFDGDLLFDEEAGFAEFDDESVFVDFFEEAATEGVMNFEGAADDSFGDFIEL